jgi:neutral trehalase
MIDISEFDKDQLSDYAKETFNVDLDLRKALDKLKVEVKKLQEKEVKPVVQSVAPQVRKATHILNRNTGKWFPWTDLLHKHLTNAVPCDKDGNPV